MRPDGILVPNERLTTPPTPPRSYAHISDTAYMPALADKIRGVDLLFHETTYTEEHRPLAKERGHSTAREPPRRARPTGRIPPYRSLLLEISRREGAL